MDASLPTSHDSHSRPDLVNSLADHLLQYPQDIVDAKRLIKDFQLSAQEFNQALLIVDRKTEILNVSTR